jgi:dethiobiotin synthetase
VTSPKRPSTRKTGARQRQTAAAAATDESTPPEPARITLVTGTDTGVGKTWVTTALARALTATGQRVMAIKAIETGCTNERRDQEDGALLAAATGQAEPREALIRLRAPVAPVLAAEQEGVTIDLESLVSRIRGYASGHDLTLVEGAGGLLSPLTWQDNALDLAHGLDAKVLVVATDRIGVINQAVLTLRALETARATVVGLVLTAPSEPDESTRTNAAAIARLSGLDLVWTVPRLDDPIAGAEAVKEVAGWLLP